MCNESDVQLYHLHCHGSSTDGVQFFMSCSAGDKIKKIEMSGTCGMYGGRERCAQGFGGET